MTSTLPSIHLDAKALSDRLLVQIINEIKQIGPMSFARYMSLALYANETGYYRNTYQKLGEAGDFVTAPEISPLFSYCVANQCAEILRHLNGGDIVEFGAGSGVMAADLLIALNRLNQLPNHYYILELSAQLKAVQIETIRAKIPAFLDRVVWLSALPAEKIQGVILANEVLDAMPVHQFMIQNGVRECGVDIKNTSDENPLTHCLLKNTNAQLIKTIEHYNITFPENYVSEVNLQLPAWIKSIADLLSAGVILLMDYGFPRHEYYHPDRSQGTLMCHFQHYTHSDPLILPGLQDITAHVDFTAVALAAKQYADVMGFTNQASFLLNNNLLSFLEETTDEKKRIIQNQQILKLTMPNEMGELVKVIAISKQFSHDLSGFLTMNQLVRL